MKNLLTKKGKFVFAVDTVANKCLDDLDYKVSISVKTKEGFDLILKTKILMMKRLIHNILLVFMNYIMNQNYYNKN